VSNEASLFPIHFFDSNIFCEKCGQVEKFKIFSQEKYDKNYGKNEIPPNKPLFCKCETCNTPTIYATHEFAELQEEPTQGFCKIWGMGNLEAGDMVFHPEEKLCAVESVVYGISPHVTLINKKQRKMDFPIKFQGEHNVTLYRLFPQNFRDSRVGDSIYHTDTKLAGKVVGLRFNGEQTIIVTLENGEIQFCGCGDNGCYLTDKLLEQNAKWRCQYLYYAQNLQIHSDSKILYISCRLPNYGSVCELNKIISSIPQARCFIMHIEVKKSEINSETIYLELLKNDIYICCCHIELDNQDVYISGYYPSKNVKENIYRALSNFPIKKITLDVKTRSDIKHIKTINEEFRFIKIAKIKKYYHLDGWVINEKEKKKAKRKAFFHTLSFKILNHIKIMEN
jgi:hypothetical protein